MKLIFFSMLIITLWQSCSNVLCGELSGDWLSLKMQAGKRFSDQLEIENIPCEFYYINIKIKSDSCTSDILKELHKELYDSSKNIGWPTFVIYNKKGDYLFHDAINGVRYKKK